MGTRPNPAPRVAFGPFEYDELSGTLSKYGTLIRFSGKPLQILSLLLDRPGQIFSRDELQRHLWEDTTFVDFEQGLNSAMNKLRQTLADSADQPRYVETLPGKGYRFIAPVQRASSKAVLEMASPAPLRIEPRLAKRSRPRLFSAACAILAVVAGAGYWIGKSSTGPVLAPKAVRFAVLPPVGYAMEGAASRQAFALSPDGTRLAFTAMNASGELSVFLRDLNSLEPRLIAGSEDAHTLFWPPDGKSLFLSAGGKLWRAELQGGAHVFVADSPSFMFSGAWLSSGRLLLDSFQASYLVSPSGGIPEKLKGIYWWPEMLPGGERFLYVVWDAQAGRHRARVARISDFSTTDFSTYQDLIETDSRVLYSPSTIKPGTGHLLYIRGGSLLARPFDPRSVRVTGEAVAVANKVYSFAKTGAGDFSVSESGAIAYQSYISRSQLIWVDRSGKQIATIGPANINVKSARLSPDGRLLATAIYEVERGEQDIWIFDVKSNSGRRLASEPALRDGPVWSPDSRKLAFLYQGDGSPPKIHVRGLGEKDAEIAMPAGDFQLPTGWSPDGRFLAFANTGFPRTANEIQGDVWGFDLSRGGKAFPLLNTKFHEGNAVFSPDGKWLAFTSNESGRVEAYVQAFQSGDTPAIVGERYLVSRGGALAVRWRRDQKELFYLGFDGRVQAVSVRLAAKPDFGPPAALFTISTEARAAIHSVLGFDVSADGKRFVIVRAPESPSIVVIQNWENLLAQAP